MNDTIEIELDEETYKILSQEAKKKHISLESFLTEKIENAIKDGTLKEFVKQYISDAKIV